MANLVSALHEAAVAELENERVGELDFSQNDASGKDVDINGKDIKKRCELNTSNQPTIRSCPNCKVLWSS